MEERFREGEIEKREETKCLRYRKGRFGKQRLVLYYYIKIDYTFQEM